MSSTTPNDSPPKPTPPPPPSSAPPKPVPTRPDIFTQIRRFSDNQFSTLLHNLIGVPTIISQPNPPKNWILDSDLPVDHPDHPRPRARRSGSDSLVDEMKRIREEEENGRDNGPNGAGGGTGGGGMGIQRTVSSTGAAGGVGSGVEPAKRDITPQLPAPRQESTASSPTQWLTDSFFRPFDSLPESHALWNPATRSPLLSDVCSLHRCNTDTTAAGSQRPDLVALTELDYYEFFERQMAGMRKALDEGTSSLLESIPRGGTGMEAFYEEVRTLRDLDGAVRTKRVQVRRFQDGREERMEREEKGDGKAAPRMGLLAKRPGVGVLRELERSRTTQ
ncbi:hypothetical protein EX30DRAFT_374892 [Ascodesmis nigricans]|uniref:Uncharacterized protein n=1 Tax=Ascodesmis nigricans TaxID=341454 RepID=A0A4S2MJN1_9PEZI|nr:hypothetical protein EX30DRAFT_374892 [Ascodesmis nigricans]